MSEPPSTTPHPSSDKNLDCRYNAYKESINHYLVSKAAPLLQDKVSGSAPNVYLTEWKERWHKQTLVVKGMKKLFMSVLFSFCSTASSHVVAFLLRREGIWIDSTRKTLKTY